MLAGRGLRPAHHSHAPAVFSAITIRQRCVSLAGHSTGAGLWPRTVFCKSPQALCAVGGTSGVSPTSHPSGVCSCEGALREVWKSLKQGVQSGQLNPSAAQWLKRGWCVPAACPWPPENSQLANPAVLHCISITKWCQLPLAQTHLAALTINTH